MAFSDDLEAFALKVETRSRLLFERATEEVQRSVVDGSEITGAPGQPVDTGNLKGSWIPQLLAPWSWQTTTGVEYAEPIEEGIGPHGPLTLRSAVGGFHSVRLTRAGWGRIVEAARTEVVGRD